MKRTLLLVVSLGLLLALRALAAETGVFDGFVVDAGGAPVEGAMVTATSRGLQRGTTVYTTANGAFRLPPLEAGAYDVRVRRLGYQDVVQQGLDLHDGTQRLRLALTPETDPNELAWQLPSSLWMPLLLAELSSDEKREEFTRQCTFCHQQGSWATRVPRSAEDWDKIFKLMARMGGVISPALRAELPHAFNTAYAEASYQQPLMQARFTAPAAPRNAAAVITEWDIGHPASMQHDITVHPDGTIYSVDTNQDQLYRLDPRTNERKAWDIPRGDSPLGGVFGTAGALIAPNSNAHVAPHSLQVAPDGSVWITLCLGNKVARFDPKTEQWQIMPQKEGLYPHTLRFDHQGRAWYTLAVSNHVGMIDPKTGEQRTIRLPARTWGQALTVRVVPWFLWASKYVSMGDTSSGEGVNLPVPYGIDIAPDGGVWFSQLNERRIGRIDPSNDAITLIDTPFPGPRRLRFDSQGNLWIPGFSAGLIARYNLSSGEFKTWKLPIGGVETPYALNVDRHTDTIWICGTNSDTLMRLDPASEQFTVFPLPTRVTYTREIDFDDAGGVWTSNSNFPTWQIEGPGPKIIRLQPNAAPAPDGLQARRD
ncbi:MAG: carboxypeptidase regulatory-like domain-containing protein [Deltaproteobacteria bacterium]|nr:carboxypeptidase regulatory-like domain-containing protein [Deltaproteobacteria bacterium]MBI3391154.1 carboxypeptidase regulatory-like domain-containing protein [Deltaproteobacteria bacterium]